MSRQPDAARRVRASKAVGAVPMVNGERPCEQVRTPARAAHDTVPATRGQRGSGSGRRPTLRRRPKQLRVRQPRRPRSTAAHRARRLPVGRVHRRLGARASRHPRRRAMTQVAMPRLSDSMEEGTILKWHGDELVEIETDKANMTYEADQEGVRAG